MSIHIYKKAGLDTISEWDHGTILPRVLKIEVLRCMPGHHRRAAAIGELLTCFRKPTNTSVGYAAAVIKEGTTIDHSPNNKISMAKILRTRIIFD